MEMDGGRSTRVEMRMRKQCWLENQKGVDHSENLYSDQRIILKRILWKWTGVCGLDIYGLR
jgi:hypothetical protein